MKRLEIWLKIKQVNRKEGKSKCMVISNIVKEKVRMKNVQSLKRKWGMWEGKQRKVKQMGNWKWNTKEGKKMGNVRRNAKEG